MSKGPQFIKYIIPVIQVLRDMGGSASSSEATDAVIELMQVPEDALELTNKNGQSKVRNQIAWARQYLVFGGYIDASARGVWSLTEKGLQENLNDLEPYNLYKPIQESLKEELQAKKQSRESRESLVELNDDSDDSEDELLDPQESQLLPVLKSLSPEGFERLCQRLLREYGFQNVKVLGRTGDGGIDGEGILEINPLISFKVIFQCKRHQGSVGTGMIRDFRGAMIGRADKGIFLTTGTFTMDAKREAVRDGANPIELVDGEKLVYMFERLELGVKPRIVYEVDSDFFKEYR